MLLLVDIGNTHTHLGLANSRKVLKHADMPTAAWARGKARALIAKFVGRIKLDGTALCSVVPSATPNALASIKKLWKLDCLVLTVRTLRGVEIDYPKAHTIGADRLANALAARHRYGVPALVLDFGTAVTLDVLDEPGKFVGGIIAPGLAMMTEYLHQKTALLPRIRIREIKAVIGKSTEEAMLIAAVHGYPAMIRELIQKVRRELNAPRVPVIATGGYAGLMALKLREITTVDPLLTLEGLRLLWEAHHLENRARR